jgi:hypothetical protein
MPVTAWKGAGNGANDSSIGAVAWSNPGNITASNNSRALASLNATNTTTQILRATSFGFTAADIPPGSAVVGIEVEIERQKGSGGSNTATDLLIRLRNASGQAGDDKATGTGWPSTDGTATYGGGADTWSAGLTDSDLRDSGFGVDIRAQRTGGTPTPAVDHVRIRVHYTEPAPDPAADERIGIGSAPLASFPVAGAMLPDQAGAAEVTVSSLVAGAVALGAPALAQIHALGAPGLVAGPPALGTPSAIELVEVAAESVATGAPTLGAPALAQVHAVVATGLSAGAPILDSPALTQVHALAAGDLIAGSASLAAPDIVGDHALEVASVTAGPPSLGTAALDQIHSLTALHVAADAPSLGTPLVADETVLALGALSLPAPVLGTPGLLELLSVPALPLGPATILALIASPYHPGIETMLAGPPFPLGVVPLGPAREWTIHGGEIRLHLAESTYIGEPDDTVPHTVLPTDVIMTAPPLPLGVAPIGPALEHAAHWDAALFASPESVANIYFEPRLRQSLNFAARLWDGDEPAGRSRPGLGAIEIANGDGWFDRFMAMGWDGRVIRLYEGSPRARFSRWNLRAVLAAEALEWNESTVTLLIKDPQARLDVPLQHRLYAGTGALEGGAEVKGRPKPVCLGYCENVPAVPVDPVNLVYQVHWRRVQSILAVRDKGVGLAASGADRPGYAELVAATIAPGAFDTCLAHGLFRLGAAPEGRVTADVQGDAPGGDYVDSTAGIVRRIATQMLEHGFADPDELASSAFVLLDAQQPAEIGFFADQPVNAAEVLDRLMTAIGSVWGVTLLGQLTVARLEPPAGVPADRIRRAEGAAIRRHGPIPSWRRRIGYRPVWATQSGDELAASVSGASRALYAEPFRYAVAETAAARSAHKRARAVTLPGYFAAEADAAAEAARQQQMFGALRSIYTLGVDRSPFAQELGAVFALPDLGRFGVAGNQAFRLIGLTADRARGEVVYELWG